MIKLETPYGIFTENTFTGQTAEEVYKTWLSEKNTPPQPSENEILTNYLLDVDMRLIMIEMGLI